MKKMMVLLLGVIAFAISTSANTVKWGLDTGESLSEITAGTIYLVYGAVPDTTDWGKKESFSEADISGTIVAQGALSSGAFSETGLSIVPSTIGETAQANRSFYTIAINNDGSVVGVSSSKSIRIANNTNNSNLLWLSDNFTTYTAVPEPCSVALLMLGIAAFGLKRRV